MPVQVDRFPVTIRKDPTVVREYGDHVPLTHSPFAAVDALAKLAHAAGTELAMTGEAHIQLDTEDRPVAVLCGRANGKATALEQLRPTVLRDRPVEDWRVWYCHGCRFAGQPDDHVDCEHVIAPGRLKLFLDT